MLCSVLLLGLLAISTVTDIRRGYVYNWNTYTGILIGLAASVICTMLGVDVVHGSELDRSRFGFTTALDSLLGFLACAAIMILCFVLFGDDKVGGGDVKLIAMIGAFLGIYEGIEALLWTFVIGAVCAVLHLIWQYGAWRMLVQTSRFLLYVIRVGAVARLSSEERQPLSTRMWLAPSALMAVIIVRFQLTDMF